MKAERNTKLVSLIKLVLLLTTTLLVSCNGKPSIVGQWVETGWHFDSAGLNGGKAVVGGVKFEANGTFTSGSYKGTYTIKDANHLTMTWERGSLQPITIQVHYVLGHSTLKLTVQEIPGYSVLPQDIAFPDDLTRYRGHVAPAS